MPLLEHFLTTGEIFKISTQQVCESVNIFLGKLAISLASFVHFIILEPAGPVATPAFFLQGGSTASAVIADDDDFSDFVTAPAQQNGILKGIINSN